MGRECGSGVAEKREVPVVGFSLDNGVSDRDALNSLARTFYQQLVDCAPMEPVNQDWTFPLLERIPGTRLPGGDRAIDARRSDDAVIRGPGETNDLGTMQVRFTQHIAYQDVTDLNGAVGARRGKRRAVGRPGNRDNPAQPLVLFWNSRVGCHQFSCDGIPYPNGFIRAADGDTIGASGPARRRQGIPPIVADSDVVFQIE